MFFPFRFGKSLRVTWMQDTETETEASGGGGDGESLPSESAARRVMSEDAASTSRWGGERCQCTCAGHQPLERLLSVAPRRLDAFDGLLCLRVKLGCLLKPTVENKVVCGTTFEK